MADKWGYPWYKQIWFICTCVAVLVALALTIVVVLALPSMDARLHKIDECHKAQGHWWDEREKCVYYSYEVDYGDR